MNNNFASDLKSARLQSGLTQEDCAHLLGISTSRISNFETGQKTPNLRDICAFSILFGQSFESLFNDTFDEVKAHMSASFDSLPEGPDIREGNFERQSSLNRLYERLNDYNFEDYDV
jgi:transcriptional regulator with XRE-family HTH domain